MRVASRRVSARQADPPQFLLPQILSRIRIISGKKRKKKIIKIHDTRDVYVCPPNLSRSFFLSPLLTSVPYIRTFFSDCIGRNDFTLHPRLSRTISFFPFVFVRIARFLFLSFFILWFSVTDRERDTVVSRMRCSATISKYFPASAS